MSLNVRVCQSYEHFLAFSKCRASDRTEGDSFCTIIVLHKFYAADCDFDQWNEANIYWELSERILGYLKFKSAFCRFWTIGGRNKIDCKSSSQIEKSSLSKDVLMEFLILKLEQVVLDNYEFESRDL